MTELETLKKQRETLDKEIKYLENLDEILRKIKSCFEPEFGEPCWVKKIEYNTLENDGRIEITSVFTAGLTEDTADKLAKLGYYLCHFTSNREWEKDIKKWYWEFTVKKIPK